MGNRARMDVSVALRPWGPAWRAFVRTRASLARRGGWMVRADVRECYPSIRPLVVERTLLRLGCRADAVRTLRAWLERLEEHGARGLPIGPDPSAILANAVLAPADRAFREGSSPHVRWVDDVWAGAEDRRHA